MTAVPEFDAIMLIGFGGPETMSEVRPFLDRVLAGRPVPPSRYEEVVHHYEAIGGRSPINEVTRRQAAALSAALVRAGCMLPVVIGQRNAAPFLRDALSSLYERGSRHVLGVILAAHESAASHGRYREAVARARAELGAHAPSILYSMNFHADAGFIAANAEHVQAALLRLPEAERAGARVVFTAHSIPSAIADEAPYEAELTHSAELCAAALGGRGYRIAYQSRSGSPRDPWLEPDVNDVIRDEAARGTRALVLSPLGFVCDHVEVLYDLDVEAAQTARDAGVAVQRASAANDHPAFIDALAQRVLEALADPGPLSCTPRC
jgi:ferrochelatase